MKPLAQSIMRNLYLIMLFVLFAYANHEANAQARFSAVASGNWNAPATWSLISGTDFGGNGFPDGTDSAFVMATVPGSLTVTANTSLTVGFVSVAGGSVSDGTHEVQVSTGTTLTISGGLQISEGNNNARFGRFMNNLGGVVIVNGDLVLSGTVAARTVLSFAGSNLHLNGNANFNSGNSTIQSFGGFLRFTSSVEQTITGSLTVVNLVINKPNTTPVVAGGNIVATSTNVVSGSRLNLGTYSGHNLGNVSGAGTIMISGPAYGNTVFPGGTYTNFMAPSGTGTIEYFGDDTLNIAGIPPAGRYYHNVVISGSGLKTITNPMDIRNNLLVNPEARLISAGVTTEILEGQLIANGFVDFSTNASAVLIFSNKSANQTIQGSGTVRLRDLYLDKTNYSLSLQKTIAVLGTLQWQSDGYLNLNNNDLILGPNASLTPNGSFDSTCMIRMDSTSGPGSLIKRGTTTAQLRMTYPIGTGRTYSPMVLNTLTATIASGDTASISVKAIPFASALPDILRRFWRVQTTGLSSITDARPVFFFRPSDKAGNPDYVTRTASFITNNVPSAFIATDRFGVNTSGNAFLVEEWGLNKLASLPKTYYSYQNGNWSNPSTWTQDPSGATLINSPGVGGPNNFDRAIILPGDTIAMNVNNRTLGGVLLHNGGLLNLGTSSGHNFGSIGGRGHVRIASLNLPSGDYSDLVAADSGTFEYNLSASFTLPSTMPVYNNLILALNDTGTTATQLINLAINGSLTINRGTWMINNGVSTTRLTTSISRHLTVAANGRIRVGTANTHTQGLTGSPGSAGQYFYLYHTLSIGGNFTNNGKIRFTNLTQPILNQNSLTGAVTVFLNGNDGASVNLNGPTDFQNLILDKGTYATEVALNSSNTTFFRLFGRVDLPNIGTSGDPEVRKSLILNQGTLRLSGSILIPTLTEAQGSTVGTAAPANYGPHYTIPNRSHLILDGAGVTVHISADNQAQTMVGALQAANLTTWTGGHEGLMLQGSLTVNSGTLTSRNCTGIMFRPTGSTRGFTINNGTVQLTQFREHPGVAGNFEFRLNGGTFQIMGSGFGGTGYATGQGAFSLANTGHSFYMTGGTLLLSGARASAAGNNPLLFDVRSGTSDATGGVIEFAPDSVWSFGTRIYNYRTSGNTRLFNVLIRRQRGSVTMRALSASTLNGSLTIEANASLRMENNLLNIGRDFTLNGGFFHHTDPVTSAAAQLRFRAVPAGTAQNLVINAGATYDFSDLELRPWTPSPVGNTLTVSGTLSPQAFTVRSFRFFDGSTFNDGGFAITVTGLVESWGAPAHVGTGKMIFNCTRGTIFQIYGSGTWTNIDLEDPDGYILMNTTFQVNGVVNFNSNSIFNADVYEVRFGENASLNISSPGPTKMFQTSGSTTQGGMRKYFGPTGGSFLYHFGTSGRYRPATVSFTATANRNVLIRPVAGEHPNTTFSQKAIQYHWKYYFSSNSGLSAINIRCDYQNADIPSNQVDNAYKAGRWQGSAWTVTTYATQALNYFTITPATIGTNFDLTAGGDSAFMAPINQTYISRTSGSWHTPSTWTIINSTTRAVIQNPATTIPSPITAVEISANHTVTVTDTTPIDVPSLLFRGNTTLDFTNTCDFADQTLGIVAVTGLSAAAPARIRLTTSRSDSVQFPGGNWTPFLNNGQANVFVQFYHSGTSYRIPNYSQGQQNQLANFAGLEVDHGTGVIQLPNQSIWANSFNVFSTSGPGGQCTNSPDLAVREIRISTFWHIGTNGHFRFASRSGMVRRDHGMNTNSAACTLRVASTGRMDVEPNAVNYQQYLWFNEGFTNDGVIDLQPLTVNDSRVWMCVNGSRNTTFSGTGTTRVTRLYVERGSRDITLNNQNAGFTFVSPATGGDIGLQLVVGTYIQNHANHNWTIKTGVNPTEYNINTNGHLIIRAGTASINATGTGAGLRVDGRLTVDGTGKLRLASNVANVDNYLGIGTSGAFVTIATTDSVIVGSQFKGLGMVAAPNFTMRSGILAIGHQGAPDLARGMFASSGTNSRFKMTGGRILIYRSVAQPTVFDINIQPDSAAVLTGGTFVVGSDRMASGTTFLSRNSVGFFNLRIFNNGVLNPTFSNRDFALTIFGNDTIDAGATKLMNNFDLNLRGNLVKEGTLTGGTGVLRFNGDIGIQELSGSGSLTCQALEISNTNPSGPQINFYIPVSVSTNLLVSNLNHLSLGSTTMNVLRTLTNHSRISTSSGKLLLNGTLRQTITGTNTAQFGRIEFANSAGFDVQRSFTFLSDVVMTSGIIDIGLYRMTLAASADFVGSGFGPTKYIRVPGTLSDQGVTKFFSAGAASITVPIGMSPALGVNKYTPGTISILQNTALSSSITMRVINDKHPNTLSSNNAELKYYWKIDSTGFANLQASLSFQYDQSDANTRGNENDYDAARYGPNGVWAAGGAIGSVDPTTNILTFNGGSVGYLTFLSGDFTAGEPDEFISMVPYLTNGTGGGNWQLASTWALSVIPPANAAIRVVGTDVLVSTINNKITSVCILEENATLDLGTTTGHDLGLIQGKGKLALATNSLPSGNYSNFTQPGGGTIEYRGSFTMPTSRVVYNNLNINIPSGTVAIPNASITVNGTLKVMAGTLNNLTNRRMTIFGNIQVDNGATFTAGNGSSNEQIRLAGNLTVNGTMTSGNTRFVLFGGLHQTFGGTQVPSLNYLEISKTGNNLTLTNALNLQTQISFNNGDIILGANNLNLSATTALVGPDNASYIQAHGSGKVVRPVSTLPLNPSYALFPVGDNLGYKPITIQLNSGVLSVGSRLEVNFTQEEHPDMYFDVARYVPYFWTVEPFNIAEPLSYNVSYTTGGHSDIVVRRPTFPGDIQAYKYHAGTWSKGGTYDSGTATFTWTGVTSFSDFTGGLQLEEEPLPLTLLGFSAQLTKNQQVTCRWTTAEERDFSHFVIERYRNAGFYEEIGRVDAQSLMGRTNTSSDAVFQYSFLDENPGFGRISYRLKMVDKDGSFALSRPSMVHIGLDAIVRAYPNPLVRSELNIDISEELGKEMNWSVFDAQGKAILHGLYDAENEPFFRIPETRDLKPGIYLLHMQAGRERHAIRFQVQ